MVELKLTSGRVIPFFLALSAPAIFCACVSVTLGKDKSKRASDIQFKAPSNPFKEMNVSGADEAWQNKSNGNMISFLSTCNDPADPSLEAVQGDLLSALDDLRVINSEKQTFNSRLALTTEAEGFIDGVRTRLETLVFKKNNCIYALSYVGVDKSFADDRGQFRDFVKTFEAP